VKPYRKALKQGFYRIVPEESIKPENGFRRAQNSTRLHALHVAGPKIKS
jgi:hypothetical protein